MYSIMYSIRYKHLAFTCIIHVFSAFSPSSHSTEKQTNRQTNIFGKCVKSPIPFVVVLKNSQDITKNSSTK